MYGNYRGYYQKRPLAQDERLSLLPRDVFEGKCVLDVGCNEGWITCEIGVCGGATVVLFLTDSSSSEMGREEGGGGGY